MIIDETFNTDKLIEFLEALIKDAGRKSAPMLGVQKETATEVAISRIKPKC